MFHHNLSHLFIVIVVILAMSSCTSIDTIDKDLNPIDLVEIIDPGDEIIIHTLDNETHTIVVDSITREEIKGSGKTFEYANISKVQTEDVDVTKTILGSYAYSYALIYLFFLSR